MTQRRLLQRCWSLTSSCPVCIRRHGSSFLDACAVQLRAYNQPARSTRMKIDGLVKPDRPGKMPTGYPGNDSQEHDPRLAAFINGLDDLFSRSKGRGKEDVLAFVELQKLHSYSNDDCLRMARMLFRERHIHNMNGPRARSLTYLLSRAGYIKATISILLGALQKGRKVAEVLRTPDCEPARRHLGAVASEKLNHKAMVLEGKLAYALGDEDRAIYWWTEALVPALLATTAAAQEEAELIKEAREQITYDGVDAGQLNSPWRDLMLLYKIRCDRGENAVTQYEWVMEIGCQLDDPLAHYHCATFLKKESAGGTYYTNDWLYHITKAASIGYAPAAHRLGIFYAETGWKYIEDEPPDHVKPTPFDSYPAAVASSTMDQIRTFLSLRPVRTTDAKSSQFLTAAYPSDPEKRFLLAMEWLRFATRNGHAPSCLYLAKMHMSETLWAQAQAPEAVIDLSSRRFAFSSEERFNAKDPIEKPAEDEPADLPNPHHSVYHAKTYLALLFAMCRVAIHGVRNHDDTNLAMTVAASAEWGCSADSLRRQAEAICDERQWDIYNYYHELVYRARAKNAPSASDVATAVRDR